MPIITLKARRVNDQHVLCEIRGAYPFDAIRMSVDDINLSTEGLKNVEREELICYYGAENVFIYTTASKIVRF